MSRLGGWIVVALLAMACGGRSSTAPSAPALPPLTNASRLASDYMLELLGIMETNSINRSRLNWTDFRAQVAQKTRGAQSILDLYPAISLALGLLDDHHSGYQAASGGILSNPKAPRCAAPAVGVSAVRPDIGYVRIGALANSAPGADSSFADGIQHQIRSHDAPHLAGWIVDVRGSGGGNMWPMVAGVGAVLGDGVAGYFVSADGSQVPWSYQSGVALNGTTEIARTSASYTPITPSPKVAVLTDNLVASSGEAVVVSFRARPNTRSFGTATCGLSTANTGFRLSDGATLQLTTAVMADRNQTPYRDSIAPDEIVSGDAQVVQRATAWLLAR